MTSNTFNTLAFMVIVKSRLNYIPSWRPLNVTQEVHGFVRRCCLVVSSAGLDVIYLSLYQSTQSSPISSMSSTKKEICSLVEALDLGSRDTASDNRLSL
jgi:hypothetical protein